MQQGHRQRITQDFALQLSEHGLDSEPLLSASSSGDAQEILSLLGDLANRRYQGVSHFPSVEVLAKLKGGISGLLRSVLAELLEAEGGKVDADAPVHAGGFSWIIRVTYQGGDCAAVVPKFTSGDYLEKFQVRAEVGRLFPQSERYWMPREVKFLQVPIPILLMTYAEGENCYPRTFDSAGKPHNHDTARGVEVFKTLGEFAQRFSSVRLSRFGALRAPQYESAGEYIRAQVEEIDAKIFSQRFPSLDRYGYDIEDLRAAVAWAKRDAETQEHSFLMHGDLSPWNLLHDERRDRWTIVDGDDAKFGVLGEQLGVCLNSMRGNYNRGWIDALLDGFGLQDLSERREALLRGAVYGTVSYGLINAGRPWDPANAEMCRDVAFSYMAPCVKLFRELEPRS